MTAFFSALLAAAVLFPEALHVVRKIDDPIAQKVTTLHEYYSGNRVITTSEDGTRVAIADYERSEITVVDRVAGTYSVAPFDASRKPEPKTRTTTIEYGGEKIVIRNEVVRVTRELPPSDLLVVPPGSRRVESPAAALPRLLDELDGIRRR
jgi:hypothetical protein